MLRHTTLLFTFIFLLCFSLKAEIQKPNYNAVSFNAVFGLQEKTIYDILEIKSGLYFGSNSGLYHFNGDSIKNYKLQGYPIEYTNLKEDPKGRIWFSNFNGQIFYFENGTIELFLDRSENTGASIYYDLSYYPLMVIDGSENLVYLDLDKTPAKTKTLEEKKFPQIGHNSNGIYGISSEKNSTEHELFFIKPNGEIEDLKRFDLPDQKKIELVVEDDKALIFNIFNEHINIYQIRLDPPYSLQKVKSLTTGLTNYNLFQKVNDSTLALLSKSGFRLINTNNWKLVNQHFQLRRNSCSKYYPLNNKLSLIATLNHGVKIISNSSIQNISWGDTEIQTFTFSHEKFFFQDQEGQLWELDLKSLELSKLDYKGSNLGPLYFDNTNSKVLASFKRSPFSQEIEGKFGLSPIRFKRVAKAYGFYYATYSHTLRRYKNDSVFTDRYKRCKLIDFDQKSQTLFVDFIDGLHYKTRADEKFRPVKINKTKGTYAHSIKARIGGGMWIFDTNQDLYLQKGDTWEKVESFEQDFHIIEEYGNTLILASDRELCLFNKETRQKSYLNQSNGLLSKEILGLKLKDDQLWIVNPNGLQILDLNKNFKNQSKPNLQIKEIQVNETPISFDRLEELDHRENSISAVLNSYHIASLGKDYIEYRFLNQETDWTKSPGNLSKLDFQQLAPGNYQVEIRACSGSGFCSDSQMLNFKIQEAWFKSTWFYLLLFISLVALAFIISKIIINRNLYLEKLEREREIADKERQIHKIKALQAQMNPHFVFNALNSIQDYILSNQKELASEYLADFADLIRSYLKQSKKDFIEIEEEVKTLEEYLKLEKLRLGGDLDHEIIYYGDQELIQSLKIPVMLIQPFVENAIKHGLLAKKSGRKLRVEFNYVNQLLTIKIKDNGIGIKQAEKKKDSKGLSFGNKAIEDKIYLLNKNYDLNIQIKVENETDLGGGEGTTVIIEMLET